MDLSCHFLFYCWTKMLCWTTSLQISSNSFNYRRSFCVLQRDLAPIGLQSWNSWSGILLARGLVSRTPAHMVCVLCYSSKWFGMPTMLPVICQSNPFFEYLLYLWGWTQSPIRGLHLTIFLQVIQCIFLAPYFVLLHHNLYQIRNKLRSIVRNNFSMHTKSSKYFSRKKIKNSFGSKRNSFSFYPFCNKICTNQNMLFIWWCKIYWSYEINGPFFKRLNNNMST